MFAQFIIFELGQTFGHDVHSIRTILATRAVSASNTHKHNAQPHPAPNVCGRFSYRLMAAGTSDVVCRLRCVPRSAASQLLIKIAHMESDSMLESIRRAFQEYYRERWGLAAAGQQRGTHEIVRVNFAVVAADVVKLRVRTLEVVLVKNRKVVTMCMQFMLSHIANRQCQHHRCRRRQIPFVVGANIYGTHSDMC